MAAALGRKRVALVSTASISLPGSMRTYAETLMFALAEHAPEIEPELVELNPDPARGTWHERLETVLLPARLLARRRRAPDLWHVLDGSRAYMALALGSSPYVVTVHDIIPWLQANGRFPGTPAVGTAARALWRSNGMAFRRASLAVFVSDCARRDASDAFALLPGKSVVVHHALGRSLASRALETCRVPRVPGTVLHVGNNGFYKNRLGVLRIFARLDPMVAIRLMMAGPAPTEELLRLACGLGIADRTEWLVNPGDEALAGYYQTASVLLCPSLYEGFGWPALEAMAFGLPVVATDAGSLQEVVGTEFANLAPDDEAGLSDAVGRILCSPEFARNASERGLARAQNFSATAFVTGMRRAYSLAIENGQKSPNGRAGSQ